MRAKLVLFGVFLIGCFLLGCVEHQYTPVTDEVPSKRASVPTPAQNLSPTPTPTPILTLTPVPTPVTFKDKLTKDVQAAPYNTSDYEANKLDCSSMSALLYDWLKLKGYDVKYVCTMGTNWYGHAWLLVGDVEIPQMCTSEFCVMKHRTANGKGWVIEIKMDYNGYKHIMTTNNSYWVEATAKRVFHNLDDIWPGFYNYMRIRIYDDYRNVYENLALGYKDEFGYSWYLKEKYGTDNLTKIAEMMNN